MKSVIISASASERQDVISVALCATQVLSAMPVVETPLEEPSKQVAEQVEVDLNMTEVVSGIEAPKSGAAVDVAADGADAEPVVETPEETPVFNPFSMLQDTVEAFKGKEDFTVDGMSALITLGAARRAQEKINDVLETVEPFKRLDAVPASPEVEAVNNLLVEEKLDEFKTQFDALVEKASEDLVKAAIPEPFQPEEEVVTEMDQLRQQMKGIYAQVKQMRLGNLFGNLVAYLRNTVPLVKQEQREFALKEADLDFLIPQMDRRMLAAKAMMENPELMRMMQGGAYEASDEDISSGLGISSEVETPVVEEVPAGEVVTPIVEEVAAAAEVSPAPAA